MRTKDVNMLSGSIAKGLLVIGLPMMLMNVIQSLFSIIDMTVLKMFDTDGLAVGAVGVCSSLITLIVNLVVGIATGANVVVAKYIGKGDKEHIDRATGTAVAFALLGGFALSVIGVVGSETFLQWINCPEVLLPRAVMYFRLYFVGVPILVLNNFSNSLLRATGNSRRILEISVVGAVFKIASTCLFVAVFQLGIVGVAIATVVSWCINASQSLYTLMRSKGVVKVQMRRIRLYNPELPQILRIGVPAALQMGLYSVANVVITMAVNGLGAQATTGMSIANTFDGLLYSISTAISLAVLPYVSQNVGAGNIKRAGQAVWKGILITTCIGAFFGALSAGFSTQLSSLMSDDPVVIAYSRQKMIIISSTYFICGINHTFNAALQAMGKPSFPTAMTLIFMCGLRFVWVYCVFPLLPNLTFLYLVWPIGWVCCIICSLFVYFPTKRKLEQKYALDPTTDS